MKKEILKIKIINDVWKKRDLSRIADKKKAENTLKLAMEELYDLTIIYNKIEYNDAITKCILEVNKVKDVSKLTKKPVRERLVRLYRET